MNKIIVGSIIAIVLIAGGLFLTRESTPSSTNNQESNDQSQTTGTNKTSNDQTATFTAEQVAEHKTEDDCWTIISGSVYDLTSYIPNHPGGNEILRACGVDGTSLFKTRTTSDGEEVGSGTAHSNSAASALEQLKVGQLAN